jgi:hypothetical protein
VVVKKIKGKQGCQICLGTTYQNRKNIPNNHKIYQMAKNILNCQKYTKWPKNILNGQKYTKWPKIYQQHPSQDPPKFTQNGIFSLEICHLATLKEDRNEHSGDNKTLNFCRLLFLFNKICIVYLYIGGFLDFLGGICDFTKSCSK